MPLISLGRDYLDAIGKTMALVWMIFLLCGPHYSDCLAFCDRVVSITSDMGTERLIARMPDCLKEFWSLLLGIEIDRPLRTFLFPLALQSPGWCHGWDIILKRGLMMNSWFPSWLEGIRAAVYFFRSRLLVEALSKKIITDGFAAMGQLLDSVRVPSIAEWRWGTLNQACKAIAKVIGSLRIYFDGALYSACSRVVSERHHESYMWLGCSKL
jgi:hypothetical protein